MEPSSAAVHVDQPMTGWKKKPKAKDEPSMIKADAPRVLKPIDAATSHSPFPHDAAALANMRADQVPRFFGAITNGAELEDKTIRLATLTAMQNRVDPAKCEAMRGDAKPAKKPVVVRMNGRNYIADGHHRLAAQWLDGAATADVKFKDLEPKDNALKSDDSAVRVGIFKTDDEQRVVYGWASVITEDGEPVVDSQGDVIDGDELMKATTDFMLDSRLGLTMHKRGENGEISEDLRTMSLVHSLPVTYELAKALGIDSAREGWIIGAKVHDDETWALVKSGVLGAFSIGARAERVEIGDLPRVDDMPLQKTGEGGAPGIPGDAMTQLVRGLRAGLER